MAVFRESGEDVVTKFSEPRDVRSVPVGQILNG